MLHVCLQARICNRKDLSTGFLMIFVAPFVPLFCLLFLQHSWHAPTIIFCTYIQAWLIPSYCTWHFLSRLSLLLLLLLFLLFFTCGLGRSMAVIPLISASELRANNWISWVFMMGIPAEISQKFQNFMKENTVTNSTKWHYYSYNQIDILFQTFQNSRKASR